MQIRFSQEVINDLKKIKKYDKNLLKKIEKQLIFFKNNPKHHSLRLHKLTGKVKNLWSISVTRNVRMVYFLLKENESYFVDIGTHDQVYKK